MTVRIEKADFYGWHGYRLTAGDVAVGVAPDIGGRIMSLTHRGEELLFVNKKHSGEVFDFSGVTDLRAEKRRVGERLWGGDKTWIAPQSAWWESLPPLELDAGKYESRFDSNCVVMTSPACRETALRVERRIEIMDDGSIVIGQAMTNIGNTDIRRGIWDVTQVLHPFEVYIPCPKKDLRAYAEEGDSERLYDEVVRGEGSWSRVNCDRPAHFKYGGMAREGRVVAVRRTDREAIVFSREFNTDITAEYAHGASVEVYNSPRHNYFEIEVHAPLATLRPGQSASHEQTWRIERCLSVTGLPAFVPKNEC